MTLRSAMEWLQSQEIPRMIGEGAWEFPAIETVHVLALTLTVGSILVLDLRLVGWGSRDRAITAVAHQLLPWTWSAFVVAVISGALLFSSKAVTYFDNDFFRVKMLLMALAGLNMGIFHVLVYKNVATWDVGPPPWSARTAGGLSMLFWVVIVVCGRWIGFTT